MRLGDWVRIGNETGQVVGIRWRSMAIATNNNETIVIPNSQLMKDRVIVLARRGDQKAFVAADRRVPGRLRLHARAACARR